VARRGLGRGGPVPPEGLPAHGQADGADWREWMRDLGRRQRQLREFAGLSQEQLARLSGVSQGAVSRLEIARGLATPLLIVLKINAALARELHRLDPAMLSAELREAVELQSALVPERGAIGFKELPLAEDPELEEFVRLYRESPARHRQGILSVLRAMVSGLKPPLTSS
jgi:transcriptional regulator with XRE-family HTH domain